MKKWILPGLILLCLGVLLFAPSSFALDVIKPETLPGPDPSLGENTRLFILNEAIPRAINIITAALGITAFLGILIAAITMLTAYGNEDKINRAKTNLRYAVLGFIFVILSYSIVSIVVSVSLPGQRQASFMERIIPSAHALTDQEIEQVLLPDINDILNSPETGVSLPSGDLITEIVPAVVTNIFFFIGFLLFIAMMVGGILLIFGRGNEEAIGKAKNIILYSLMAIAMVAMAYAIIFGIANINLSNDPNTDSDNVFIDDENNQNLPF